MGILASQGMKETDRVILKIMTGDSICCATINSSSPMTAPAFSAGSASRAGHHPGKLESVLTRLQGSPVEIIGAGRTGRGPCRAMAANAQLDVDLSPEEIRDYMNRYLPQRHRRPGGEGGRPPVPRPV